MIGKSTIPGVAAIWDKRKGLDDFITLSERLGDDYQIKNLPDWILSISHTNSVHELADLYSIADVFVNPTYEDNYPTTNLEAISCGIAVITYATGGSPESAEMYGESVPKKDFPQLVSAIKKIGTIQPGVVDINYKNIVNKYVELYKRI